MSSLEFRDLDLLSALSDPGGEGIRIHITAGFLMPPSVRGKDYVIAARAGRFVGDRQSDTLEILLEGQVVARSPEAWREFTDDLLEVLAEAGEAPGTLEAGDGYLGLASGATATISARVKNILPGPVQAKLMQTWSIALESVDPAWTITP